MNQAPTKAATDNAFKQRMVEAMRLHVQGQLEAARNIYDSMLKEWPRQPDILHALGTLCMQQQKWTEAAAYFRMALTADTRQTRCLMPLAGALAHAGDKTGAMETLAMLLTLDPNNTEASNLLYELCLPDTPADNLASSPIHRLIARHPDAVALHALAVKLYRAREDRTERLPHMEMLYRHGVRSDEFYQEYGVMLRNTGQYARAAKICEEGLKAYPESLELLKLRANMRVLEGRHKEAIADWSEVLRRDPQDHHSRTSIGIIRMLTSDCRDGYEEYAAHRDRALTEEGLDVPIPEWTGGPLAGKRLLVWCSQGIGDIVMFASLLPWVAEQGAQVTLAVYPKMMPMFSRSFPQINVVALDKGMFVAQADRYDLQVVTGQLMVHVLPHYEPSQHAPFLKADAARAAALRSKYLALDTSGKRRRLVGISWNTTNANTFSHRNIPLVQWKPLLDLPNIQFVSLQYGDHSGEIAEAEKLFPGALYADPDIDSFADTDALAAQIAAMDEVVSIQNANVHVAGGLGVPTTLMLSAASDWRWGLNRTDSHWYTSVTIERQKKMLDWKPVLKRVRERLAAA